MRFCCGPLAKLFNCVALPIVLVISTVTTNSSTTNAQDSDLPRRITLGTKVQPVSEDTQQKQSLKNGRGVEIIEVLPSSNAEALKLQAGDVIQSIAGKEILDVQRFMALVGTLRAGKEVELKYYRDGRLVSKQVQLKELAREQADDLEIVYGHVATSVGKLRTVLTLPKGSTKLPTIMLLSGLGNAFVEHPSADPTGMKSLAYGLARKGYAVLRVEKPGCGDSEGGPVRDVDFKSVMDGYVAALKQLKTHSRVDDKSIWLVGASIGGIQAPLLASAESAKGIAMFGTMAPNWQEFLTSSTRRQMMNSPTPAARIEAAVAQQAAGWQYLIHENLTPDDLAVKHQELMDWVDATWAEGLYFSGIHYKFFQQLGKADIAGSLESFPGPVLALWGEHDIVTSSHGHQWLAEVVNRKSAGKGTYMAIPNVDHNMRLVGSTSGAGTDGAAEVVIDKVVDWIRSNS
ncbi:MAG: alpha/beta fold hydrolase [Pirellulales bacterium]